MGENSPLQRTRGPALWLMLVELGTDIPHRLPGRGSPAFDDDSDEVIEYVSNEGIRISRILKRVAAIGETEGRADRAAARAVFQTLTDAAGEVSDGPCSFPSAVLPLPGPSRGEIG